MKRQIFMFILLILTASLVLASCNSTPKVSVSYGDVSGGEDSSEDDPVSGGDETSDGESGQETGSAAGSNSAGANTSKSGDSKVDLKGYTFTIASDWMTLRENLGEKTPLFERLFWERAEQVEKDLNCKIKVIRFESTAGNMRSYIMAGKKIADVVETIPMWIPQSISNGYFKPWDEVPGINYKDSSTWLQYANSLGTSNGKVYGIQFLKPAEARFCVMFNKTLLAKNGVDAEGIYSLVDKKQWTWDKMREYAIAATKDTTGDNKIDTYGILGKPEYLASAFLSSFGGSIGTMNGKKCTFSLNSSASLAGLNFYDGLVNTDKVVWVPDQLLSAASYDNVPENLYIQKFNSGEAAFLIWESWVLNQYTKAQAKFDYGILPLPLGGSQKSYVSPAHNLRVLTVTSTNKDLDKLAPILNALAKPPKGYEKEAGWLEDIQADYFQAKDKKSIEMYKLILNSSMRDPGLSVASLDSAFKTDVIMNSIYLKKSTVGAAVDSIKNAHTDAINAVYK